MDLAYAPHELTPAEERSATPSPPPPSPVPPAPAPGAATSSDNAADVPKQPSSGSSRSSSPSSGKGSVVGQVESDPADATGEKMHQPGSPTSSSTESTKDAKEADKPASATVRASGGKSSASEDGEESSQSGSSDKREKPASTHVFIPGGGQSNSGEASSTGAVPGTSANAARQNESTLHTPPAASGESKRRARSASDPDSPTPASSSSEGEHDGYSLVIVNRAKQLPVVECTMGLYEMLKFNNFTGWAVQLAESTINLVASPFVFMFSPFSSLCKPPISCVDATLCLGLDGLEAVLPCIKVYPSQMCAATTSCVTNCVCCCPRAVSSGVKKICPTV